MAQLIHCKAQQRGAALAVSLVLMLVLTSLAVTLMYNSSLDTKMSHAAVVKKDSLNATLGGADEFIEKAHNSDAIFGGRNPLATNNDVAPISLSIDHLTAGADSLIPEPTNCPHLARNQVSDSYIRCNRFDIEAEHTYGKNNKAKTQVVTSIASQIPGES